MYVRANLNFPAATITILMFLATLTIARPGRREFEARLCVARRGRSHSRIADSALLYKLKARRTDGRREKERSWRQIGGMIVNDHATRTEARSALNLVQRSFLLATRARIRAERSSPRVRCRANGKQPRESTMDLNAINLRRVSPATYVSAVILREMKLQRRKKLEKSRNA